MRSKKRWILVSLLLIVMMAASTTTLAMDESAAERTVDCTQYSNGSIYIGQMKNGMFDGYGMYYNPNNTGTGYYYCGEWSENKRHGDGVAYTPGGTRYAGTFVDNNLSNENKDNTATDRRLRVSITEETVTICEVIGDNVYDGVGAFQMKTGSYYVGEVKDGRFDGNGIYGVPAEAFWYVGGFVDHKYHGEGIVYKAGNLYARTYENGERIESERIVLGGETASPEQETQTESDLTEAAFPFDGV